MANTNSLKAHVISELKALTIFELINSTDCPVNKVSNEDGTLRAGAQYLDTIRDMVTEAVEYATGDITGELVREDNYADSALPVYYDDIFEAVLDLRVWQEDVTEFVSPYQEMTLDYIARVSLWVAGDRLVTVLGQFIDECVENYEAN